MSRYKAVVTAIAIVVGMIGLVIIVMPYVVHIKPRLSPQEQQLAGYRYQQVELTQMKAGFFSGLKNPMGTSVTAPVLRGTGRDGYPKESLAELAAPGKDARPVVEKPPAITFICIKEPGGMAIINGEVVKEGDRTKYGKIVRITKNGVLMKDQKGQRWINIE